MNAEQLNAIQARNTAAKEHRKAFEAACQRFSEGFGADGSMSFYIDATKNDVPGISEDNYALLAYARDLEARIGRVRELHVLHEESGKCAECTVSPFSMHSVKWPCPTIAALTATEEA